MNMGTKHQRQRSRRGVERTLLREGLAGAVATLLIALTGAPAVAAPFIQCDASDAVACYGTPDDDEIRGSRGPDRIFARGGHDRVDANEGADVVIGGGGTDFLKGGTGDDTMKLGGGKESYPYPQNGWGQQGDDRIIGGALGERLLGGSGRDRLQGRGGDDYFEPGSGRDVVKAGPGDDTIEEATTHNKPTNGNGTVRIFGGTGNDTISLRDDDAVDYIDCGDGIDTVTWVDHRDDQDVLDDCEVLKP